MIRMVTRKVYFRPIMSPSRPKSSAPNGRTARPAAKAISAKMKAGVGFARLTVYAPDPGTPVEEVGPTCRVCPRLTCPHRVEDPLAG